MNARLRVALECEVADLAQAAAHIEALTASLPQGFRMAECHANIFLPDGVTRGNVVPLNSDASAPVVEAPAEVEQDLTPAPANDQHQAQAQPDQPPSVEAQDAADAPTPSDLRGFIDQQIAADPSRRRPISDLIREVGAGASLSQLTDAQRVTLRQRITDHFKD